MFPFGSISQGHCGCFLMWFSLFIQHLLDNIEANPEPCCHIGSCSTTEGATTTEVKRKKLQCYCTFSLDRISVCTVRHSQQRWCRHLATLSSTCSSEKAPYCLFSCGYIVDSKIKFNYTKSSESLEHSSTYGVSNIINFLSPTADIQYGMYTRLFTCQSQTMANVSPVRIKFTIGCHL